MAKVFRIQPVGSNNILGWNRSNQYGPTAIAEIKDPTGLTASKPITSIPSPFAQIELVKTAFKYVTETDVNGNYINLNGNTIYHKLVSDALDVGQIFFTYDRWAAQGLIEVIDWTRATDLAELQQSQILGHKLLGDTFDLFLKQDAQTYNFANMKHIYLLNFKKGKNQMNIIGAVSPSTLFMGVGNDVSEVGNYIKFGVDMPFDNQYMPLFKRDINYRMYLEALSKTPDFPNLFPEFFKYLKACFTKSNQNEQNQLRNVTIANISNYQNVGNAGNPVSILGINIKQSIPVPIKNSDFEIASTKIINGVKPLVLPITKFTKPYRYTIENWDTNTEVPLFDNNPLSCRLLPGDGQKHPYLTIGDFLEDNIIKLRQPINQNAFYGAATASQYLLPLKREFFDYFSVDDLYDANRSIPLISMIGTENSVKVTLKIPIQQNDYIEYSRIYYLKNDPDKSHNEGAIIEVSLRFAMAFMPLIKSSTISLDYRVALISEYQQYSNYSLQFYDSSNNLVNNFTEVNYRNENDINFDKCAIYSINQNFDYMSFCMNGKSNIIVPLFKNVDNGVDNYTFAVDLGTTNTHIEYKSSNHNNAQSFNITEKDYQISYLSDDYAATSKYLFDADFIPSMIGNKELFSFPIRTVLSIGNRTNWQSAVIPLVHANVLFTYEKRSLYTYNEVESNLKWSNNSTNQLKIQCYIENLMWIIRNKVLLNNGNLGATKIVWFYPISMTKMRYSTFAEAWQTAYAKYIGDNVKDNVMSMTESETPYNYYKNAGTVSDNMVTIDIGGETSDVVFASNNNINYITSFRFASNSIYGDGYGGTYSPLNGIIQYYKDKIYNILSDNKLAELVKVYDFTINSNNSTDCASFFYSLFENKNVKEKNLDSILDFNRILQNDGSFKIIFVVFYSAIIYYISKIIKAKVLSLPRYIVFSGKGSQILRILDPQIDVNQGDSVLNQYTQLIIESGVGKCYEKNQKFQIRCEKDPKVVTCKGGLVNPTPISYTMMSNKKITLVGTDDINFVENTTVYGGIDDVMKNNVIREVRKFFTFMFSLNSQFSFKENFGIDEKYYKIAQQKCKEDLLDYLEKGINQRKSEVSLSDVLEETLFFYPIVGALNALASELNIEHDNN